MRRAWELAAMCPASTTLAGVRIFCTLPGHSCGEHEHDEIRWTDDALAPSDDDETTPAIV